MSARRSDRPGPSGRLELAVVGAGAAGVMAYHAARDARPDLRIAVLERKGRPLLKLRITGKGRCNLTSCVSPRLFLDRLGRRGRFLHAALERFDAEATRERFRALGVETRVERGERVFPESDSAVETAERFAAPLLAACPRAFFPGASVRDLLAGPDGFELDTSDGTFHARRVIAATGGITYPATGSDGSFLAVLARLGHTVVPVRQALCGMAAAPGAPLPPAGNALKNVNVTLSMNGKKIAAAFGEMLFTHEGVSGPAVLHLSRDGRDAFDAGGAARGAVAVEIDFKPAVPEAELAGRLDRDTELHAKRTLKHALGGFLPAALLASVLAAARLDPESRAGSLSRAGRRAFLAALRAFPVPIAALDGPEQAVITMGGVALPEVDPRTMESKIVPGLHLCGELLDLDGPTGGFNLQIAFSTGHAAGTAAAEALSP